MKKTDLLHRITEKMKRRAFFSYTLAGGVGALSLKELMSRFGRSAHNQDTEPRITVSINPLAVPRTKQISETNG